MFVTHFITNGLVSAVLLCASTASVLAQDSFTISGAPQEERPSEKEPLPTTLTRKVKVYKDGQSEDIESESIVCEQLKNGDIKFSFIDTMTNEEESIVIPSVDNFGYYPLKKFLKDIERDKENKWEKCRQQLASKYRYYKQGKPVELKLVPLASMKDNKGRELILGLRPEYIKSKSSSKVIYEADGYLQIRFKGKTIITKFFGYSKYSDDKLEEWLIGALRRQVAMNKSK